MSEGELKEFYIPKTTTPIKTSEVASDLTQRSPFKTSESQATTYAVFKEETKKSFLERIGLKKPGEIKQYYAQVSREHGRAVIDTRINRNVLWGDSYGILYGSRDWKGSVMDNVCITTDRYSPYGMRADGLKDNVGLHRIEKVSSYLRQNGLPTELPIETRKVEEIIDYNRKVPVDEWKQKYLEIYKRDIDIANQLRQPDKAEEARDMLNKIKGYFESTDFYVVERDLQVAERIRDITHARAPEEFAEVVKPVFSWVNVVAKTKHEGVIPGSEAPNEFKFEDDDIKRYFGEWLPKQMGTYLARMHKLGLAHGYPHAQNWSLVGTLYDLDSVHGAPLGDEIASESDYQLDTKKTLEALAEMSENSFQYLPSKYPGLKVDAQSAFVIAYTKERFGENIESSKLDEIRQAYFENYKGIEEYTSPPLDIDVWRKVTDAFISDNAPVATQTG